MYCTNCGKTDNREHVVFCANCGARLTNQPKDNFKDTGSLQNQNRQENKDVSRKNLPKKQHRKGLKVKIILLLVLILLLVAEIGGAGFYFNSAARQLAQDLSKGKYSSALNTYTSSVENDFIQKWLANLLISNDVADIMGKYENENVSYEEALACLETIGQMTELDVAEEADSQMEVLRILYESRQTYDLAESYYESGNYVAAIGAYLDVDESDSKYYEEAQSKIASATEKYRAQIVESVGTPSTAEEYGAAISLLDSALAVLPDDEELVTLLETCEAGLEEAVKSDALSDAAEAIANGDYEEAFDLLEIALVSYPEDSDLQEMLSYTQSQYKESISSQVNTLIEDDDYETAISLLNSALTILPDDEKFVELLETCETGLLENYKAAATEAVANEDYEEALELLETALKTFPEDGELQTLNVSAQSQYEGYIISKVDDFVAKDNYDDALELISEALLVLPGSTVLKELQTETEEMQPVKLSDLKISDSYHYEQVEELETNIDVVGNIYNRGNLFKIWIQYNNISYADYYLNNQYTRLTGTIAVSDDSSSKTCTLTIFGDENTVLYTGTFTRTTAPITIDIDLSGVEWLEIQVDGTTYSSIMYLLISDFVLYKN